MIKLFNLKILFKFLKQILKTKLSGLNISKLSSEKLKIAFFDVFTKEEDNVSNFFKTNKETKG